MTGSILVGAFRRNGCDNHRRRVFAAVAVMITLVAAFLPLVSSNPVASENQCETTTVEYHLSYGGKLLDSSGNTLNILNESYPYNDSLKGLNRTYTATYYGSIVSTEYNPQVWEIDYEGDSSVDRWLVIKEYVEEQTLVFTGWAYATKSPNESGYNVTPETYLPGDVMDENQIKEATDSEGTIHVYATWGYINSIVNGYGSADDLSAGGSVYTNFVLIHADADMTNLPGNYSAPFTTRSVEQSGERFVPSSAVKNVTISTSGKVTQLRADTIVDNVNLIMAKTNDWNHGDDVRGLFANGHSLVLGTGVKTTKSNENYGAISYPMIFGGTDGSSDLTGGTRVIIHSGVYSSVIAGSYGDRADSSDNVKISGGTHLVMRGGAVLDTIVGGSSSQDKPTVDCTYIYILGDAILPGDTYQENQIKSSRWGELKTEIGDLVLTESSILTGGSNGTNNGTWGLAVTDSTNVYISGNAEVWDVQGPGRRASTVVDTANVEISGRAWVKHMVSGSITDGNSWKDSQCVKHTNIVVRDEATVGSVFGAGYDTWASPEHVSMFGGGTTINVSIDGGTVGYVYGGGYRGTVGTERNPIDSINIEISGNSRILHDVFGGGRGGVDKILHNEDGSFNGGNAYHDTTGLSEVYADSITISIAGGTIDGNVYGGGESVPVVANEGYSGKNGVASVHAGAINILIGDTVINGSVFGAGKGVFSASDTSGGPSIIAMGSDGKIQFIPWMVGTSFSYLAAQGESGWIYSDYASVESDNIHIRFENYRTGQDPNVQPDRYGSIYGGGMYGTTTVHGTLSIEILDSTVADTVFGGGMGDQRDDGPGRVTARTISIEIDGTSGNGSMISHRSTSYSVFGGGQQAHTVVEFAYIILEGDTVLFGDVHGGGLGSEGNCSMDGDRAVVLNGATVNGNVFGGSRFGEDSTHDSDSSSYHISAVLVIGGTVTQAVYGGGFQGASYLDSYVRLGTPAIELAETYLGTSAPDYTRAEAIHVGSVYGGSNLGDANATPYSPESALLKGNTQIEIGLDIGSYRDYATTSDFMRIEGDIFGEGNYSALSEGKTAIVYIHDYIMPDERAIMSIQRCDELYIVDSRLVLRGSTDGGTTDQTERFSMVRIGLLQIDRTVLELYSNMAHVEDYRSVVDGVLATPEQCVRGDGGGVLGNEIVLHGGSPFTLMNTVGSSEASTSTGAVYGVGTVHGYTLLSKADNDDYYGAYAIGTIDPAENSGFMVNDGAEEASVMLRKDVPLASSTTDQPTTVDVYTWYLAGHFTLAEQVIFQSGADNNSKDMRLQLPRLDPSSGTTYTYIGSYVSPTVQNGMYLVSNKDYTDYNPESEYRTFLGMSILGTVGNKEESVSVTTHTLSDGTWVREPAKGSTPVSSSSRMNLKAVLMPAKENWTQSVGILGEITINMTESVQVNGSYVPINMIDIVITVYVNPPEPSENVVDIFVTVMATGNVNGTYSGRGHINLPRGDASTPRTFTIDSASGISDNKVLMWSDTTHLGLSGWTVIRYTSDDMYQLLDMDPGSNVYFGEGGIRATTIGLDYTGGIGTFNLSIRDGKTTYNVTVDVCEARNVSLQVSYQPFTVPGPGESGNENYNGNLSIKNLYVTGTGTKSNPFTLVWSETAPDGYGIMSIPYGTVISSDTFWYRIGASNADEDTLASILELSLDREDLESYDKDDSYLDYLYGWYLDPGSLTRYNTGSQATEDLHLYAGFGVNVTFHGQGVTVYPQTITLAPGQRLGDFVNPINLDGEPDDNKITVWNGTIRPGYHLAQYGWMYESDGVWTAWNFETGLYDDLDLYLVWDVNWYDFTVSFIGYEQYELSIDVSYTIDGTRYDVSDSLGPTNYDFRAPYNSKISISIGSNNIIRDANVSWMYDNEAITLTPSGLNTREISFTTPNAGENDNDISVSLEVSKGYTLNISYMESPTDIIGTDDRLTVTLTQNGVAIASGTMTYADRTVTLPLDERYGNYVVNIKFTGGSTNTKVEMYWSYYVSYDGQNYSKVAQDLAGNKFENIRGKTQDPYCLGAPGGDIYIRLEMHKAVELVMIGSGIGDILVDSQSIKTDSGLTVPSTLFANEVLSIQPMEGYHLPPTDVDGLSPNDDGTYLVLGDRDVRIYDLQTWVVNIVITPVFMDGSEPVNISAGLSWTVSIGLYRITGMGVWSGMEFSPEGVPRSSVGYNVTVNVQGFETAVVVISANEQPADDGAFHAEATLQIIHYQIVYHDTSGNVITPDHVTTDGGVTSVVDWTVADAFNEPRCYILGAPATATASSGTSTIQLWFLGELNQSQTGYVASGEFCTGLEVDLFQNRVLHLFALEKPAGDSSTEAGVTAHLLVRQDAVNDEHPIGSNLFSNGSTRFESEQFPYAKFTYNSTQGTLTISGVPPGSGSLIIHSPPDSDGTVNTIVILVFTEPAAGSGGVAA